MKEITSEIINYFNKEKFDEILIPKKEKFLSFTPKYKKFNKRISNKSIIFIDGGNNSIYETPNINLSIIKSAGIEYINNNKKRKFKKEYFCLIKKEKKGFEINLIDIINKNLKKNFFFDNKKNNLNEIVEKIRMKIEKETILELSEILEEGSIVILDGTIKRLKEIDEIIIKKNIMLIGLIKTNKILDIDGKDILQKIRELSPNHLWTCYIPSKNDRLKNYIVKLNEKSQHLFRFEILKKQIQLADFNKIFGIIASNSTDPLFLGYPYGLILADKYARVSNLEISINKIKFEKTIGKSFKLFKNRNLSLNAHEILDSIN